MEAPWHVPSTPSPKSGTGGGILINEGHAIFRLEIARKLKPEHELQV